MLLTIKFNKEASDIFDQIHVDIRGAKVKDPSEFISVKYVNSKTGETSREELLSITDLEKYEIEEAEVEEVEPKKSKGASSTPDSINHSPLPIKHDKPTEPASN